MYFDQFSESRTWAPRIGTRLCMLCEQFSAMHSHPPSTIGEEEVHLRRRLGLGRELEDDPDAVDDELLTGLA